VRLLRFTGSVLSELASLGSGARPQCCLRHPPAFKTRRADQF
jgi:hypothetical protein